MPRGKWGRLRNAVRGGQKSRRHLQREVCTQKSRPETGRLYPRYHPCSQPNALADTLRNNGCGRRGLLAFPPAPPERTSHAIVQTALSAGDAASLLPFRALLFPSQGFIYHTRYPDVLQAKSGIFLILLSCAGGISPFCKAALHQEPPRRPYSRIPSFDKIRAQ